MFNIFKKKQPNNYDRVVDTYYQLLGHPQDEILKFKFEYYKTVGDNDYYHLKCLINDEWIDIYQSYYIQGDSDTYPLDYHFEPFEKCCKINDNDVQLTLKTKFDKLFPDKHDVRSLVDYYKILLRKYEIYNNVKNPVTQIQKEVML